MKRIVIFSTALMFLASLQLYSQDQKPASNQKPTPTTVKQDNLKSAPVAAPQKPKLSKQDSIKRQHRLDSLRKVMADKRAKEGRPKLSKEDSLKRAHKIDSIRAALKAKGQSENHNKVNAPKPKLSKEDSLKRVKKLDSLRKANADKLKNKPAPKK